MTAEQTSASTERDDAAIDVQDLHKYFGDNEVLTGIDVHVDNGQVVCVIGPSGSGKSTLLRCINLLEIPTKGKIFVEGEEITDPDADVDKLRSRIGMVFQQFNLFPHMTVLRNLTIAQEKVAGRSKDGVGRDRAGQPGEGRPVREGVGLPGAPLGRPDAASRDRSGALDASPT